MSPVSNSLSFKDLSFDRIASGTSSSLRRESNVLSVILNGALNLTLHLASILTPGPRLPKRLGPRSPQPIRAPPNVSLGATCPGPPRTCRGTISGAAMMAVVFKKLRRLILRLFLAIETPRFLKTASHPLERGFDVPHDLVDLLRTLKADHKGMDAVKTKHVADGL